MEKFKAFDAYPKTLEDFRVRTTSGAVGPQPFPPSPEIPTALSSSPLAFSPPNYQPLAQLRTHPAAPANFRFNIAVSVVSAAFILWLFLSEFYAYVRTDVKPELLVDSTRGEKLRINMDIVFPNLPCAFMSIDSMDASGEHQLGLDATVFKTRLSAEGKPLDMTLLEVNKKAAAAKPKGDEVAKPACGDCYGADPPEGKQCCDTCEDVQEAYRKKGWAFVPDKVTQCVAEGFSDKLKDQQNEGCRVYGHLLVNKVQGNFHIAPGKSFQADHMHVHDLETLKFAAGFNLSHSITHLTFGMNIPGGSHPLAGVKKVWTDTKMAAMYQYFIKIVPTIYQDIAGEVLSTNQYAVTEHTRPIPPGTHGGLPGVFFNYDLAPLMVKYTETRESFAAFVTSLCAIIGGVFTVAGLVDSFIYSSLRSFKKKMELGKAH